MAISLDKLQDLFKLREEYSSKLSATERQIRALVGEPDSQASEPAAKTTRKRRVEIDSPNDSRKLPDVNPGPDGACSEAPSVAPGGSDFLTAIGRVILQGMNPGTTYSKAELFQIALDASGEGTDPEQLKTDVGNSVREMVADGFLTKSGEAKGTRYSRVS